MRARYKKGSDAGLAVVVLVLAAILGGLVYMFWEKIMAVVERPTETVVEKAPPPPPRAPVVEPVKVKEPEPVVEKPPPPPRVSDVYDLDGHDVIMAEGEPTGRTMTISFPARHLSLLPCPWSLNQQ